jgi:competence protein ComEA
MLATSSSAQAEQITAPVNLNTATASELEQLPGVGPVLAENIIQHRKKYGPFARPEHLLLVKGISNRLFKQLSDKISVNTSSQSAP